MYTAVLPTRVAMACKQSVEDVCSRRDVQSVSPVPMLSHVSQACRLICEPRMLTVQTLGNEPGTFILHSSAPILATSVPKQQHGRQQPEYSPQMKGRSRI